MRFINEEGKLFGLINPIDLGVILLLLVIGVKVISDFYPQPLDTRLTPVTIGLLARDVPSYLVESLAVGQDLFLDNPEVYLGKIRAKKAEPALLLIPGTGEITITRSPQNYDLRVELRRSGRVVSGPARSGVYLGRLAVRIGDRLAAHTLYTSVKSEVEYLKVGALAIKLPVIPMIDRVLSRIIEILRPFGILAGRSETADFLRRVIHNLQRCFNDCVQVTERWRHTSATGRFFYQGMVWLRKKWLKRFTPWSGFGIIIEQFGLFLLILLPVLSSRWVLVPVLIMIIVIKPHKTASETAESKRIGNRFIACGVILACCAVMAPAFNQKWPALGEMSLWLVTARLVGLAFPEHLHDKLLRYWILSSIGWMALGFWQLAAGIPTPGGWLEEGQYLSIPLRIYSVFGNPNIYALYLVSILALTLEAGAKTRREKAINIAICGLTLISLYFTYARAAWLMAAGYLLFKFRRGPVWVKWPAVVAMPVLFLLPGFRSRIWSLAGAENTLNYRIRIWQGVWSAISRFWFWGNGPGSFGIVYPFYERDLAWGTHAHSLYLQLWLEYGLVGLLTLLILWLFLLGRNRSKPVTGVVVAVYLIGGLSESWMSNNFSGWYFWIFCGMLSVVKRSVKVTPSLVTDNG